MPEKNVDVVKDINTSNKTGIDVAKDPVSKENKPESVIDNPPVQAPVQKANETRWNPVTKKTEPYFGPVNKVKDGSRSWEDMKKEIDATKAAQVNTSKPVDVKPEAPKK